MHCYIIITKSLNVYYSIVRYYQLVGVDGDIFPLSAGRKGHILAKLG